MKDDIINILLTGATGFIGNYFKNKYANKYNINTFSFLNDNFEELNLDNIDAIIHLSALVHQMSGVSVDRYENVNVIQTINLAKKAKQSGVRHFIFMSTIAVYGKEIGVINKNTDCNPINDYGKSKLKAELELQKIENDDFKISIIRPAVVSGYNAPGNMKSIKKLVNKISILPFAGIKNRRSMIYVGNLCHLIDVIIQKKVSGVFLASDDKPISITKLIELIADILDKKIYLIKIPFFSRLLKFLKPDVYKKLYENLEVDIKGTKEVLKFENIYSVEDGIKFMIHGENI